MMIPIDFPAAFARRLIFSQLVFADVNLGARHYSLRPLCRVL